MIKKFCRTLGSAALLLFLSIFISVNISAQEITGSIFGSVRDNSGAVIPGANITITDPSKDNIVVRSITANENGDFTAPNLPVGVYTITVESANFKKTVQTDIKLDVGARRTVDIVLEAGDISEVVTVEAEAVAVDLQSATSGTVINGDQVRELSINNRNFVQLVTLAPGVSNDLSDQVYVGTTNPDGQANTVSISVNGARSSQNTFTVDGADITDRGSNITIQAYPSVDSIGEFRVLRSLYPAESGRSGGGQVNVVTRSGGKNFSGSAFEFIRNEAFNANDYITNASPGLAASLGREDNGKIKRRPFRYNNYGWTLGGPVFFLNFGERDPDDSYFKRYSRTFFFFSQELRKDTRYPTLTSTVPNANLRQGIFTSPVCLQASGTTCTQTLAASPTNPLSITPNPIAQQYINQIYNKLPLPTTPGSSTLQFPTLATSEFRQEIFKLDHSFSDTVSMYYRYQQDKIPTVEPNSLFSSGSGLPGVSTTETNSPGKTHTGQVTASLTPNFIIEGRFTYGYGAILSNNVGLLSNKVSTINNTMPYANQRDRIPTLAGNGYSNLQGFGYYDNFSWKKNYTGTATYLFGNHITKFGIVFSQYRKNENALTGCAVTNPLCNEGIYYNFFTPGGTQNVIATGGNTTIQSWANFLLGTNASFAQASFDYTADLRQQAIETFVQDEWRFRKNITLYYGVRYSYFGSPWDKNGRLTNFDPSVWRADQAPAVTGAGNRVAGTGNFCNGIIINSQNTGIPFPNCTPTVSPYGKYVTKAPKTDFAPRVGIAWDPFGKGMTSIRTGYGIYHEQVLSGTFLQNIGTNPPFQRNCRVTNTNILNLPTGDNCPLIVTANLRSVQPEWETPYMQHWSLDWQQQLDSKTVVTVGYYGSKGTNLIGSYEKNLIKPGYAIERGPQGCATGNSYFGQANPTLGPCQVAGQAFYSTAQEAILDQIRPFRGYLSIAAVEPQFNSNYHSMQISAQRRFSGASQLNFAYTWARNMTDSQNDRSASPQNPYDIKLEYARAALDRRHVVTFNYIYELPFFSKQKGFVGKVLGGWQASGIASYNSGLPFTPTVSGFDPSGLGIIPPPTTVARPNYLCDPNSGGGGSYQQWFNTTCFQVTPVSGAVANNLVGNGGRGIVDGPSTKRVDFTMTKNLRFGETFRIQLRAEAFNVFNITNFRGISTVVWNTTNRPVSDGGTCTASCSTFGQVTSVRDPRIMQFGAKVYF